MLAGEVRDNLECCNWMVKDQAVEFRDDEQTEISHMHFAIERLLDGGIPDQDEVAEFKVILDDGGSMLLFKTDHGFDLSIARWD